MEFLFDIAKRYSLPFALLCIIVWWQNSRLNHIENKLEGCEAAKFKIITENNDRSNEVIRQNTIALERNTEVMENLMGIPNFKKNRITAITAHEGIHK